jgi:competence protein ComEC
VFRQHLDALGLRGGTVDAVVISHAHFDHYSGLRELFKTSNNIRVRYLFENRDAGTAVSLGELRDSIDARVSRGELIVRDTDDPCGDGRAVCTVTLNGGAKLHVMRPDPTANATANNRSTPVKLVGPDSASFSMWFAGDAEHEAQGWFDTGADYDRFPGMKVEVLKANHHGSCNGVTSRFLDLVNPTWVTFSVSSTNTYGHVHSQTKELFTRYGKPWYRTDLNGNITFRSPGTAGGGYTVAVERGIASQGGSPDRASSQEACQAL